MARTCSRTGCARAAAATMSYGYGARTAWLDDLDPDHSPSGYDLCAEHADGFVVPQGWERADRRTPVRATRRPRPAEVWDAVLPGI